MYNNNKLMFFMLTMFSTMFLISAYSWLNMWMWLEINLISFTTFLINKNKHLSIESSLIYFLIQTIASIMLLFSLILITFFFYFINMIMLSLMIKVGSAPVHYWLVMMIEGLNWMDILMLLTWQKISPLIMIYYLNNFHIIFIFIIFSSIIGSLFSLNFNSIKKILIYSSINQMSWIFFTLNYKKLMIMFLIMYFFLMINIIYSMNVMNIKFINQFYKINTMNNKYIKLFIFMNFISLGGLPPFIGFFPKMLILMQMNNIMIMLMMLMMTLLTLFMYIRIIMSILLINSMKMNLLTKHPLKKNFLVFYSLINNMLLMTMFFYF